MAGSVAGAGNCLMKLQHTVRWCQKERKCLEDHWDLSKGQKRQLKGLSSGQICSSESKK